MTIKPSPELVTVHDPDSPAAEAFRMLRTNIVLRDFDNSIKMINVISASAGEAKSTVALNLAYVYSQMNKKVLVVDLDLKLPSIHKKLNVKNDKGITNVIAGLCKFKDAVVTVNPYLHVITSGEKIPFSSEFVQSKTLQSFLKSARDAYDMVIIDCPPVNLVTDGMIISRYCDGSLLCIASGQDDKKELIHFKDSLEQLQINVLGIVMTKMPKSSKKGYYSYGYYGEHKK